MNLCPSAYFLAQSCYLQRNILLFTILSIFQLHLQPRNKIPDIRISGINNIKIQHQALQHIQF